MLKHEATVGAYIVGTPLMWIEASQYTISQNLINIGATVKRIGKTQAYKCLAF